jgi:uncharacterized protein (TIGR04255 family)
LEFNSLPFVPANPAHSITEVVFGLIFDRPFDSTEVTKFASSHREFEAELPGKLQAPAPQMSFNGLQVPLQFGVVFDRYNPAGALEKRLRLDNNSVYVNNLLYTRWDEVSTNALGLIERCLATSMQVDNTVRSLVLQYVDLFRWMGDVAQYDLSQLLDVNSPNMTKEVFEHGPLWHLHQGWYKDVANALNGRLLERTTIDGVLDSSNLPVVRFDSFLQLELSEGLNSSDTRFGNDVFEQLRVFFGFMHDQNKSMLKDCLTEQVIGEIGL